MTWTKLKSVTIRQIQQQKEQAPTTQSYYLCDGSDIIWYWRNARTAKLERSMRSSSVYKTVKKHVYWLGAWNNGKFLGKMTKFWSGSCAGLGQIQGIFRNLFILQCADLRNNWISAGLQREAATIEIFDGVFSKTNRLSPITWGGWRLYQTNKINTWSQRKHLTLCILDTFHPSPSNLGTKKDSPLVYLTKDVG